MRVALAAALLSLPISCTPVRCGAPGLTRSLEPFCLERRWNAICLPEPYPC